MSLAFLVPLFLLGVAGIVVPIVIHLTRRQRRNVVHFPSLMFLQKIPYQEQRRRRIQHWFLLSLRAAALALLALAFARPFLDQSELGLGLSSGPREVVVLVDQSYSMAIGDRLERAKDEARDVFGRLGPLDRASVVAFSQGAAVLARSTSDPTRLRGAVDTIVASSRATRYGPALKLAQTIIEESTLPAGEVVLLSDFQRNGWGGDEGVRLPPGSTVTTVDLGDDEPLDNVLVTDVTLPRQIVSGRERVTATARIARQGGRGPVDVPVSLEIDGQEIATRTVTLAPGAATAVTFTPFTLSLPHTRGTVRVPSDDLDADDSHHFVTSPGSSMPVLVMDGSAEDGSLYLMGALEITEDNRFGVSVRRSSTVRPADLDGTAAVFLNDVRIDGGSAERIREFVTDGGGVLVALGEEGAWPASAADMLPGIVGPALDRLRGQGGRLGYLDYDHPVFEVFSGPRSGDFTGARFYRVRAFQPSDSATVIARFDDGAPALVEGRIGEGRILVWTSTLDDFWNDLALQPVYLPFVHRLAEHLGGRAEAQPWFITGQVVDLANPASLETAGLVSSEAAGLAEGRDQIALTPTGSSLSLPANEGPRYLPLDEHGFYTVREPGTDPDRPFVLAVNVELEESDLTRIDPQEMTSQITAPAVEGSQSETSLTQATELRREDMERRQSLWRWLLLAALLLFVGETALSNLVSRKAGPRS